jgi:hypothetical protein
MNKVVIVGGGPAGLFAAHKLAGKCKVTLIDKGKEIRERKCPKKQDCVHCNPCQIDQGIGGAGLFSDGKLLYHTKTGNNLSEIVGEQKNQELVDEVESIFASYGVATCPFDIRAHKELIARAESFGITYMPSKQAHVGSDKLPDILDRMVEDIKKNVMVVVGENAEGIDTASKKLLTNKNEYDYDCLILSPGRAGAHWLKSLLDAYQIRYEYQPLDIGVRVEVPAGIMKCVEVNWDFKARMRSRTYGDIVRTFCVCPYGFVTEQRSDDYCLVNGHSEKDRKSLNTNFAFLATYKLKEPLEDQNEYGKRIAANATFIGGGKPLLQRLIDLRSGQRSTWQRIEQAIIEPTLSDVTPGDIGSALPYRFVVDILDGLDNLDNLIPGVAGESTLLYAPEIKFLGIRVKTDEYLRTSRKDICVAGDSPGFSRGIVGAAASGLLAAYGILDK